MKKIKSLLILGTVLFMGFAGISQSIFYRFNNYYIVEAEGPDTLIFDVEAKSDVNTTYTTTFTLKINFSTTAFGSSAVPVVVQKLALASPSGYNLNTNVISAGSNRFASTFKAWPFATPHTGNSGGGFETAYLSNLTTDYQGVVRYKMLITGTGDLGIQFQMTGSGNMTAGQSYVLTSGGTTSTNYTPVTAVNNLINLPPDPTNFDLMITEIGDPSNTTTNFVEIYNAGTTAVDLSLFPWYLSVNGSSSVMLTGSIPAGAIYTVGYDNTDFLPSLVSTVVGTGGNMQYLLSVFGDYSSGNAIDVYDGMASGFDFTGKHAVRHYDVMSPNPTFTGTEWVVSDAFNTDMTPGSHGSTLNWNGASASWRTQANWAEGFIPDAGHNVEIPDSGITPVISNGSNAFAHNLTIGNLGLTIESDAVNGDGSLITYGTVTGTATVERYLAADRFWYVSKPVTNAMADVFLHMWLYTYNEAASTWDAFIEDETTPLETMKGYAVWTSSLNSYDPEIPPLGSVTTSYDNTPNSGPVSTSLTKAGDGWNFTGNPYPSALDWEAAGWTKTNLANDMYVVWNGATNSTYSTGGGSTNGGTRYIPAAQGFFVQAGAPGTLGVNNSVRTHSTQDFWKSDETMENRLSLTISNGQISDETVIYFNESATPELDYSFDARKLMAVAAPQAYTKLGEDLMAINTFNNIPQTPKVTMGINAPEEGEYSIIASNIESFDATTPVYLEDLLTGQKVNLRETNTYTFSSGEGTTERFVVHFAEYQGIGDNTSGEVNNIYAVNQTIYVDFKGSNGAIAIYNILGQEINRAVAGLGLNKISVPYGNTVYIVKVISDNSTVTKKVFVK